MQFIVNGILAAGPLALAGLAFAIVARGCGYVNLALGAFFVVGPYIAFALHVWQGLPLAIAVPVAVMCAYLLAAGLESTVFSRLRAKGGERSVLLISSLGIYVMFHAGINLAFGPEVQIIRPDGPRTILTALGARMTEIQLATLATAVVVCIGTWAVLKGTRAGSAFRAVAVSEELARVVGINISRVRLGAAGAGAAIAALCGCLVGLDTDLLPGMGLRLLFGGLVVSIVGGVGSTLGILLGAISIGLAQHLGAWKVGTEWQDAITFMILLTFLVARPEGMMGVRSRQASV